MCQLFISADDSLWSSKTKSLRIQGVVTSIRLEVFFWDILEELSFRDQMTVNQLITKLYLESLDADHDIGNFTSFLRVCCSRYLSLIADGDLSRETALPLEKVDAKNIIERENLRKNQRSALFNDSEKNPSVH
ncbi:MULTISPECIES: ribbon-helix-helix domain-containing protein [unclassified Psychrobacter]|jgi:predicted DNA-binding ribbon-helix-helix protein|uniref:ribbon-helix-helix domain-containing protein n=1 Tax=unclassified Psychrobacter TaxID=196806 RepID=UPI00086C9C13|nr:MULTISPECIES: ribbon-helix-helix domain-containing protein [unclassified Psychrobacter]MBA6243904.1 ribbon-helix-helix domain-containing protein [Psychrobacter sp. Urea-trap-18]MBA6285487.1 ribbon-helix-helix domain-containing protein [Psychrobacter sp. Urea-trap-16]MBA6318993.1 ribbon-helix-helix domain-containing protein [Psychrobacter sp. Urea-trap-20]MBA6335012.1 ribbon-helix-helix domain-containing protein [Psychrobacter sp. Urea-trap-19]MCG3859885.1 ribbon-helix-helix domain-containin|tara:strand:- start:182 stop:580 length:399 start_codon:yes stop_codon:yes gene_type:complete